MQKSTGFFLQFLQLAGPFWNSEHKTQIRSQSLLLIILTMMQIGVAVIINEWSAHLFNALEQRSMSGLLTQIGLLILILAANVSITYTHLIVKRRLQIGWRSWLTERVSRQWMHKGRHYQVTHIEGEHDNPDGRIAEDIRVATEDAISLCHTLFYSLLLLISFTTILWNLSGVIVLDLWLVQIPLHGHLVWIAIVYAAGASALGWWVGQPLIKATDTRQTMEANFRFGLVTARENSQAIALIHGDESEQKRFKGLFQDVIEAFNQQTHAWGHILMFTSGYSVLSTAFPVIVSAPRYILGSITLGALMQSAQAFQQMASALSWPVDNMAAFAQWRASAERVLGLIKALEDLDQEIARPDPHRILLEKADRSALCFQNLCLSKFNGEVIISDLNLEITAGEHLLISGDAATAAKLFKAIAGLWPWGCGRIELPDGDPMFFMPPRPYLPNGTLCSAICYPSAIEDFNQADLENALRLVDLDGLLDQLDQTDNWDKSLSREQQQRLGVVRLLLYRPKWILLQEAFDSLDPTGEVMMLRIINKHLPDATILSITNQPTAEAFHQRRLVL